jgi:hypothetical protein
MERSDAVAAFEEVGGEGVSEGVAGDALVDAREPRGLGHGALGHGLVQVVPALSAVLVVPAPPSAPRIPGRRRNLSAMASGSQVSPHPVASAQSWAALEVCIDGVLDLDWAGCGKDSLW